MNVGEIFIVLEYYGLFGFGVASGKAFFIVIITNSGNLGPNH